MSAFPSKMVVHKSFVLFSSRYCDVSGLKDWQGDSAQPSSCYMRQKPRVALDFWQWCATGFKDFPAGVLAMFAMKMLS